MSNRITAPFPNWNSTSEGICLLFKITYYIAKQTRLDLEGGYTSMLLCDYRSVPTDFTFFHTCWDKWHTHSRIRILKIFNVSYLSSYKQSLLEYFPKLQTWGRKFTQRGALLNWNHSSSTPGLILLFCREFGRGAYPVFISSMIFFTSFQFRFTKSLIRHPLKSWISVLHTTQRCGDCCIKAIFRDCQAHQPQTTTCSHGKVWMQASASKQTTHRLSAVQSATLPAWCTFCVSALSSSKNRSMIRGIFSVSMERRSCRICCRSLVPLAFNERWNPHQNTTSEVKQSVYARTIETIEYPQNLSRRWLEVWLNSKTPENVTNIFVNWQNRIKRWSSMSVVCTKRCLNLKTFKVFQNKIPRSSQDSAINGPLIC